MDASIHWTWLLDLTTGQSDFPFMDKFLCSFSKKPTFLNLAGSWLATMIDCNNNNSCLLQCYQQCINLKLYYSHLTNTAIYVCKLRVQHVSQFCSHACSSPVWITLRSYMQYILVNSVITEVNPCAIQLSHTVPYV